MVSRAWFICRTVYYYTTLPDWTIKVTKVGGIQNPLKMWEVGFSLVASPLALHGGSAAKKAPPV